MFNSPTSLGWPISLPAKGYVRSSKDDRSLLYGPQVLLASFHRMFLGVRSQTIARFCSRFSWYCFSASDPKRSPNLFSWFICFVLGFVFLSVRKFTTKLSDDTCGFNIPSTTFLHPFKQTTLQNSSPRSKLGTAQPISCPFSSSPRMSLVVLRPSRCGRKPRLRPLTPIPLPRVLQQCVCLPSSDLSLVHANLALGDPPLAGALEPRKIHSVLYAKQGDLWRRIANTRWPLHCSSPGLDFSGERALAGQVRM
ncbi:hypothetical protein L210DRAFT_2277677 [Boletus edulis BED1]|uniref:Uncharacterized protein n=1 Tax=Boletus edulis BED1 TaxID=1328754 RepID=A0AAD4GDC2_BOLED|nr:hypothetical protein L210DRAFT_2277677 [Boletus edulis BED1]